MSARKPRVVMIGNSHIDPVWLWREDEGLQEVKATFASALERMEEFPEFQFTASSAAFYAWVEENHPEIFQSIQKRVAEGRWHLVGGWWVEPDLNVPCGESLVRQGLYAQRFFLERFGKIARVAFNVDSFGHSAGVPGILAGQGIQGYVFMRPQPHQLPLPDELFRWTDGGGASVTACRISGEYTAWTKPSILANLDKTLQSMRREDIRCMPCYYGVGNHGGGPTVENIKAIREIVLEQNETDIGHGGLEDCLDEWRGLALPERQGELEGCFPGCFSADSEIKRLNREGEEALIRAETLCAMAKGFGFPYPTGILRKAWQTLLFQQFHDTLAGTARKEARDEAVENLHACLSAARAASRDAAQAIAAAVDTRGEGFPLLVINPGSACFKGILDADISWRSKFPLRLKDPAGMEAFYDESARDLVAPDARRHVVFRASLPPFGYVVYRLLPEKPLAQGVKMDCAPQRLENGRLLAKLDRERELAGLRLKEEGLDVLGDAVSVAVYEDLRDTWGAEGGIGRRLGEYRGLSLAMTENGAVRSAVRTELAFNESRAELTIEMGAGDPLITMHGVLDNREKHALTVLRIPLAFLPEEVTAEIPYGELPRPCREGMEEPCQRSCDVHGGGISLLVLNRAEYAYRISDGAFELVLSRSPVHAFGAGQKMEEGRVYDYVDQGRIPFSVQLHPRAGAFTRMERLLAAQRFHRPPCLMVSDLHEGPCALREQGLVRMEGPEDVILHLLKEAEDGGIALRLQNTAGEPAGGSVSFRGTCAEFSLGGYALGTLILNPGGKSGMSNLLEFFLGDGGPQGETANRKKMKKDEKSC